jgi:hypothetical protein
MTKYYRKLPDIVKARQWNSTPLRGVTVRGNKGYITIDKALYVLNQMDWILEHEGGRLSVLSNEEFLSLYEFEREDEYDEEVEVNLYVPVEYEAVFEYKPENRKRRKNGSEKGSTAGSTAG